MGVHLANRWKSRIHLTAGTNDTCLIFTVEDPSGDMNLLPTFYPEDPFKLRAVPPRDVLQATTKAFLQQAIERCDVNHEECKLNRNACFLPTRLIDVREENVVRLVAGSTIISSGGDSSSSAWKYAALSYCWGPKSHAEYQLKTTVDNLDAHFTEIPMDTMPPLLQDAIYTTRELGVPFLWIDSLCIIQGDKQDWDREAGTMHKVYGSAYITICPTQSKSCKSGFLRRDPPSISLPYRSSSGKPVGTYNIRYHRSWIWKMYFYVSGHPFSQDLISGSWIRRGWTFQEAALSSRMVLFGAAAAHFQCQRSRVTEGESFETPVEISELALFPLLPNTLAEDNLDSAWKHIVSSYSQRKFTQSEDAIVALAGLARRFHSFQGTDEYCSGMWLSHLHEQLLWRSAEYEGSPWASWTQLLDPQMPEKVRVFAPSWSWIHQKKVEYQYLKDSLFPRRPDDSSSNSQEEHSGMSTAAFPGLTGETLGLVWRLPDNDNTAAGHFIQWRGQELEITGLTARFPLANADRPLHIDNSAEVNTNLFWKWTISNQYFCHTNWDFLNFGYWDRADKGDFQRLRMLLLSSGSGERPDAPTPGSATADNNNSEAMGVGACTLILPTHPPAEISSGGEESQKAEQNDRAAFGLFLFPAGGESEDGKFYRVGTWYSLSEGKGGLANFKRYATAETLVLI